MKQFYLYLHFKPNGDLFYVGKGFGKRYKDFSKGRNKYHKNIVAKYGQKNIEILYFPRESNELAIIDEILWIRLLRTEGYKLVNITDGGEGVSGYKHNKETLIKMSLASKGNTNTLGRTSSDETKRKISLAHIGKTLSPETKRKISEKNLGRIFSEETKMKMSAAQKGRVSNRKGVKLTDETRRKCSLAKLGILGIPKSPETKAKISASMKSYRQNLKLNGQGH